MRKSLRSTHYHYVGGKRVESVPPGHWLLAVWRLDPAASPEQPRLLTKMSRQGCADRRYWLRAYAALPERFALLLYPLQDLAALLAEFNAIAGGIASRVRIINDDAELERAARYVESLPVRSRLAERPEEYPWSSLGWIGLGQRASVITPHGP